MVQTPNIKREKPAEGTRPWTDAVNGNWDKIDEAVQDVNTALNLCALTDLSNLVDGLFYGDLTGDKRVRFSNGLVLQWGSGTIKPGTKDLLITLPIEYTKYFRAFVISNSSSATTTSIYSTSNNGLTGFYAHRLEIPSGNEAVFSWFTIGI